MPAPINNPGGDYPPGSLTRTISRWRAQWRRPDGRPGRSEQWVV